MRQKHKRYLLWVFLFLALGLAASLPASASTAVKPARPKISSAKLLPGGGIQVKWDKTKNAKQYEIYLSINGGKYKKLSVQKKRSCTLKDPIAGATYRFKIRAVNGKKKGSYSRVKKVRALSVWGYYSLLLDKMTRNGKKDSSGHPMLALLTTSDGNTYTSSVIYDAARACYRYRMNCKTSTNESTVTMEVSQANLHSGKAAVDFTYLNSTTEKGFSSKAELTMSSYKNDTDLELFFHLMDMTGQYTDETVQTTSNLGLWLAFYKWDELIRKEGKLQFSNLGFPAMRTE